jgi:hypothetical protein
MYECAPHGSRNKQETISLHNINWLVFVMEEYLQSKRERELMATEVQVSYVDGQVDGNRGTG